MPNLQARTEIHDARTNIALAEAYMMRNKYKEAAAALIDAERHYRGAQYALSFGKSSDSILNDLADLKGALDQLRTTIRIKTTGKDT